MAPLRQNKRSLGESIAQLEEEFRYFKKRKRFKADDLEQLTKSSFYLIDRLEDAFAYDNNAQPELDEFLEDMLQLLSELHQIAQSKKTVPPPRVLNQLTSSFNTFINKVMLPEKRTRLRKAVSAVPILENVIFCCETIPSLWNECNREEKICLALGTILVVSALAFTIASFIVPNPIPFFMAPVGIMLLGSIGTTMYRYVVENPKGKNEERNKINSVIVDLDAQMSDLQYIMMENFKHKSGVKETLTYSDRGRNKTEIASPAKGREMKANIKQMLEKPIRHKKKNLLRHKQRNLDGDAPIRSN